MEFNIFPFPVDKNNETEVGVALISIIALSVGGHLYMIK
jgi:hypothetical protein